MQFIVLAFTLLLAGISALPQNELELDGGQAFITVTNRIQRAVNNMNQRLRENGYDPLVTEYRSTGIDTPFLSAYAHLEDLECTGLSHNKFDRLSFNSVSMRLNFNLVWPSIACVVKSQGAKAAVLGREFEASNSGILQATNTRIEGSVRVRPRPISGVSIIDCSLLLSTNIESELKVVWHGRDISHEVNGVVEAFNQQIHDNKEAFGIQLCNLLEQAM
ncbi:uncharacterized protein LOC125236069 [Leguminivora glycinivorella]|uniref:uncharacterized protein LOC125236069 n=1 Tax=Leguminivora glycinivorella TaxID=1035111 RepID=UPI00200E7F2A|nr:uncharacterized protein LOC125236069 [Leguminivora glycinivorella]